MEDGLDLQKVLLHLFQRGEFEGKGQIGVEGAELTLVVGASRRSL
jgi:hypothetical protein